MTTPASPCPRRARWFIGDWASVVVGRAGHWFDVHFEHGQYMHTKDGDLADCWVQMAAAMGVGRIEVEGHGLYEVCVGAYCSRDEARKVVSLWCERVASCIAEVLREQV